jgi:mono/diheme cytochrome c family protein
VNRAILIAMIAIAAARAQDNDDRVARGEKLFADNCASCHRANARGTAPSTDLIQSTLVRDDENGANIAAVLHRPHPAQFHAADAQIRDIAAWLHARIESAADRGSYQFLNLLTGDPAKGEQFFNGAGKCSACHSPRKDLAGIGEKYDPSVLQSLWLNPRRRTPRTVTVTPPSGTPIAGTLERIDEFNVVLRDATGSSRSFSIDNDVPRVEVHDPLQPHFDLYPRLTDADIHNMTAYLATLK